MGKKKRFGPSNASFWKVQTGEKGIRKNMAYNQAQSMPYLSGRYLFRYWLLGLWMRVHGRIYENARQDGDQAAAANRSRHIPCGDKIEV